MQLSASTNLCPYCQRSSKSVVEHLRKSELCRSAHGDREQSVTDRRYQHRGEESQPREENTSGVNHQSQNVDDGYDFAALDDHDEHQYSSDGETNPKKTPHPLIPPNALYNPKPSTQGSDSLDVQMEGYIKLLCFLEKIQAPIKAFDELMKLLSELETNRFNFSCYHKKPSLKSFFPQQTLSVSQLNSRCLNQNEVKRKLHRLSLLMFIVLTS
jgi:hypothetical protein